MNSRLPSVSGSAPPPDQDSSSPFRGPQPFTEEDGRCDLAEEKRRRAAEGPTADLGPFRRRFAGRDKEVGLLVDMIMARSEVILHGPSGRGKTSLIQAGVVPRLLQRGCRVLPTARVTGPQDGFAPAELNCVFAYHAVASWLPAGTNPITLAGTSLAQALSPFRWKGSGRPTPLVAVFDPFNEFFTTQPHREHHRTPFFQQLREAMDADPLLRAVFVVRDEYVATLAPYTATLPDCGLAKLRLYRLSTATALQIIRDALKCHDWQVEPNALEPLTRLFLDSPDDGSLARDLKATPPRDAPRVEPLYLQMVGRRLYENLRPRAPITVEKVQAFVDRYQDWDLDRYLEQFYTDALERAVRGTDVPEKELRYWVERDLVTGPVSGGAPWVPATEFDAPAGATDPKAQARVFLRELAHEDPPLVVERELGGPPAQETEAAPSLVRWYELTHRRFGPAIQSANAKWAKLCEGKFEGHTIGLEEGHTIGLEEGRREGHTVGLEEGRREGQQEGRKTVAARQLDFYRARATLTGPARLLTREELIVAEAWRDSPEVREWGLVTPEIAQLLHDSRAQIDREENKRLRQHNARLRFRLIAAIVAACVAAVFAGIALWGWWVAIEYGTILERQEQILKIKLDGTHTPESISQVLKIARQPPPRFIDLKILDEDWRTLRKSAAALLNEQLQAERTRFLLDQHPGEVDGVAFGGSDNLLLATACADGSIRVWCLPPEDGSWAADPITLKPSEPHTATALAFGGPNRSLLSVAYEGGAVWVWKIEEGGKCLEQNRRGVQVIADPLVNWNAVGWHATQESLLIAAGSPPTGNQAKSKNGYLRVLRITKDGTLGASLAGTPWSAGITALAMSPDEDLFATVNDTEGATNKTDKDRIITYWTTRGNTLQQATFPPPKMDQQPRAPGKLNKIALGHMIQHQPAGGSATVLATAGEDGTARLWSVQTGELLLRIDHPTPVRALDLHDSFLATAGRDGKVRAWSILALDPHKPVSADWQETGHAVLSLTGHASAITDVKFCRHGPCFWLASGCDDHTARVWDLGPQAEVTQLTGLGDCHGFAVSHDLEFVACCDRTAQRYEPLLLTLTPSAHVNAADVNDLWKRWLGKPNQVPARCVAFHPEGPLAVLDNDRVLTLWPGPRDPSGERPVTPMVARLPAEAVEQAFDAPYGQIAFSATGSHVAFAANPWVIRVFPVKSPGKAGEDWTSSLSINKRSLKEVSSSPGSDPPTVKGFALDAKGERLALACEDEVIRVFPVPPAGGVCREFRTPERGTHPYRFNGVAFSPDGRLVAGACGDNVVYVWEYDHPDTPLAKLAGHTREVKQVVFHPARSNRLASVGEDGAACVWELPAAPGPASLLYKFGDPSAGVGMVAFDQSGNHLATASSAGRVRVYVLDPDKLTRVAEQRLKEMGRAVENH
jgi:WD40 repeat protein